MLDPSVVTEAIIKLKALFRSLPIHLNLFRLMLFGEHF